MFGLFDDPFDYAFFPRVQVFNPHMNRRRKMLERMLYYPYYGFLYDDDDDELEENPKTEGKAQEEEKRKDREFVELFKRNYNEIIKFIEIDGRIAVNCFTWSSVYKSAFQ